ncbi:MAG: quinone-dependent dihydroorotate dehydrogenase [Pseudobdellovibrio sp.]
MLQPWLWLPPKLAHDLSPLAVELYSLFQEKRTPEWSSFSWQGLEFKNRLGLAGGVDKNAQHLLAWEKLGCGFVEVGTVTPLAQSPNPGKIFDRSIKDEALWNKMGFPSAGSDKAYYNLRAVKAECKIPLFVNIGKNRTTPNELAYDDYNTLIERFHEVADAFVVNISSPNTKGLRDLANKESLEAFLKPIMQQKLELNSKKPILLKLSPDLEQDSLKRILDISIQNEVDGFVLTNTTLSRNTHKNFSNEGGVSGKPLAELAKLSLKTAIGHLGSEKTKKLVISVGGVMTEQDVFERISIGADLVEVYTALVFSGLNFFRKVEKAAHEFKQAGL